MQPCLQRAPTSGPDGETGIRKGLKIPRPQGYAGSTPAPGTTHHALRQLRFAKAEFSDSQMKSATDNAVALQ